MMQEVYSALETLIRSSFGIMGTVIIGHQEVCPAGTKFVINELGIHIAGELPRDILDSLQEDIRQTLAAKAPRVIEKTFSFGAIKIFLDPVNPKRRLIIYGGGNIAQPLVTIGALLEFEVIVLDDRPSFANTSRFPGASRVICRDFATAIREMVFDRNTYVVIVTRGHRHDKTCLAEVLKAARTAYTGMIGSRRKVKILLEELLDEGFAKELLDNVYAPIGMDIGAQTPAEIALSIMAEIIMVSRYGYSRGLKAGLEGARVGQ